ncbi:hypothetical protein HC251_14115 [Iamia sp. SCSIO 61187]|uniref:hypothetical protein n=1 Tax=Iamia sp. SCSIO 61187 TaxID=2722752 RepID=UPI001C62E5C0|nr:hypothetical protein [Iamia sp. SCSIO 61187]QYG93444.1 hypothetical protein HC251_14115 [Iamia sp. SCSIO 61187]
MLGAVEVVVVRWLPEVCTADHLAAFLRSVRVSLTRLGSTAPLCVIRFAPGQTLSWHIAADDGSLQDPADLPEDIEIRCRAVEVAALLAWGKAVWRPQGYHYRLPSGTHSDTFIRMADAVRSPRDAIALASWMLPDAADGLGVVADSASLTPIIVALHALMRSSGLRTGRVAVLEAYPFNQLDTTKAFRDVSPASEPVIGLLSVHATGTARDRMQRGLASMVEGDRTLHVVIAKQAETVPESIAVEGVKVTTWHAARADIEEQPETCGMCRGPDKARFVQIDPRSFGSMVLPAPDLVMPSVRYAADNRRFWELADAAGAIELEGVPGVGSGHPRMGPTKRMTVKVSHDELLSDGMWALFADACVKQMQRREAATMSAPGGADEFGPYDAVVVDVTDISRANFEPFLHTALGRRLNGPVVVFDGASEERFSDPDAVVGAPRLLFFRLGAVSGLSLQRTLVAIQDLGRTVGVGAAIDAVVVHLRPASLRRAETLFNSFATRLLALWDSVLPEDRRSPLQDELDALSRVTDESLPPDVQTYLEGRRAICSDPGMADPVLWGIDDVDAPTARLSPHSYYGENLRARAAYASIGAAVHEARLHGEKARGAPLWRQFEVGAIVRSYYDPIIIACIFRWLRPGELWWGGTTVSAKNEVADLIHRGGEGTVLLVAELLVAASMGKLTVGAKDQLRAQAQALVAGDDPPVEVLAGLALLDASE